MQKRIHFEFEILSSVRLINQTVIRVVFLLLFSIIFLGFGSCSSNDDESATPEPTPVLTFDCNSNSSHICSVEPSLVPLVNSFFEEAAARGITMPKENIQVVFVDAIIVNGESFSGFGYWDYKGTGQRRVEIARTSWRNINQNQQEILMFHELGHALLERIHENSRLPNCSRSSIMCGGSNCGQDFYSAYSGGADHRRDYYIDELFDTCAEPPEWAVVNNQSNSEILFMDEISTTNANWRFTGGPTSQHHGGVSDSIAHSGSYALAIRSTAGADTQTSAVWSLEIKDLENFQEGAQLTMNVMIKMEGIQSGTFAMSFQGRDQDDRITFFESSLSCPTDGPNTNDFTLLTLPTYCVSPAEIDELIINIGLLPETTGLLYIDDVSVVAEW